MSAHWDPSPRECVTCGDEFIPENIEQVECDECFEPWRPDNRIPGTEIYF